MALPPASRRPAGRRARVVPLVRCVVPALPVFPIWASRHYATAAARATSRRTFDFSACSAKACPGLDPGYARLRHGAAAAMRYAGVVLADRRALMRLHAWMPTAC